MGLTSPLVQGLLIVEPGTDHPFFPPLDPAEEKWPSVQTNYAAISRGFGDDTDAAKAILGGNAVRILGLDVSGSSFHEIKNPLNQNLQDLKHKTSLRRT